MEVRYNVTGARRKELAQVISNITGARAKYQYTPTFAYQIDFFTLTKEGTLVFSDRSDTEIVEEVLEGIAKAGFECEPAPGYEEDKELPTEPTESAQDANVGLTVAIPREKVAVENLNRLLDAKGNLIRKALGIDALPVEVSEDTVSFPWFPDLPDAGTAKAYTHLIAALCEMSVNQKRVTAREKTVENEKYAFRCFLLRLGFIGAEYKEERKVLLRNLAGNSAFKSGSRREAADDAVPQ
ncbi:MAG: virulence protein [Clostridiales bacterium]|nr:virulence protein [Clostridiales bacterium]